MTISSRAGVAGALADAVDGAFHLARTGLNGGEGIGHRQAEIVVAMGRNCASFLVLLAVAQMLRMSSPNSVGMV